MSMRMSRLQSGNNLGGQVLSMAVGLLQLRMMDRTRFEIGCRMRKSYCRRLGTLTCLSRASIGG